MDSSAGRKFSTRDCLLLVLVLLPGCFAFLGSHGLLEPDEGRYAEMAREMLATRDWLVPQLHGFPHYQKPPVIYWLTAGSFTVFGQTEMAARLPSALAACGTAWLVFIMGRRLFSYEAGLIASLALVSSVQFFLLSRMATPDMVMTFWITAALASFTCWSKAPLKRRWLWIFFAAMGLGFLTKGPMALVVPISAVLCWQFASRKSAGTVRIPWARGLLLTLGLGLSWFVLISVRHPELFRYFLYDELVARVATKQHGRYHGPWFFVPVLLLGFMPWTFFQPSLLRWLNQLRRLPGGLPVEWWFLIGWIFIPFVILSFSGSKLITYALPLFPALALGIGGWWSQCQRRESIRIPAIVATLFLGSVVVGSWAASRFYPLVVPTPALVPLLLILGSLVAMIWGVVRLHRSTYTIGISLSVGTLAILLVVLSQISTWNNFFGSGASMRAVAREVRSEGGPNPGVFAYGVNTSGLEFYLGQLIHMDKTRVDSFHPLTPDQKERLLASPNDAESIGKDGQPVFGIIKANRFGRDYSTNTWRLVERSGSFALVSLRTNSLARPPCARH